MILYKTLKEKSIEWNISLRHLQYLCQKGRIDGAIKKAGAWFIPDTVPAPLQYTKVNDGHLKFIGTKKKIFNCAVELFQSKGFEAVSIKDIADAVGITQSSMYNHFKSKQELLDTIYDFYRYHFLKDRPLLEEIEPVLKKGSVEDIVLSVRYLFNGDYVKIMAEITTIIFHRCAIDSRARELTKSLMIDEGVRFVEAVFDRAVKLGRLAPMDTHTVSMLINSIRIFTLHNWLVAPENEMNSQLESDEIKMYRLVANLFTDLKFPNGTGHSA